MANVKNILYVHGLGGSKESTTCKNLHEILRDCTIFADDFDLFDVAGTQKKIENLIAEHDIGTLIGSSFGAFYVLARKAIPFRIVITPCMKPSIEIPKLDPSIPEKTVEDLQKLESAIYVTQEKTENGIFTSVMKTTTFGIFGLCDELFSYREFFEKKYGREFEIPIVFTTGCPNDNSASHIFNVEGAGHKMTKEQLSSPILKIFDSLKELARVDDEIRRENEIRACKTLRYSDEVCQDSNFSLTLEECIDPILTLEEADNLERRILSKSKIATNFRTRARRHRDYFDSL